MGESEKLEIEILEQDKRNIPGIKSDTYHQGYFEDKTDRYQMKRKVETQYAPLIQSLYLFGILLFGFVLLAFLAFIIRECVYNYRNRKKQEQINEGRLEQYWKAALESAPSDADPISSRKNQALNLVISNRPQWGRGDLPLTFSGVAKHNKKRNSTEASSVSSWDNTEFVTAAKSGDTGRFRNDLDVSPESKYSKSERHNYLEVLSTSSNKESISTFCYYTGIRGVSPPKNGKRVYKLSELMNLKPKLAYFPVSAKIDDDSFGSNKKKREKEISKIILHSVLNLEPTKFYSAWKADKTIKELSLFLTKEVIPPLAVHDMVTKDIMMIKLLAVASNDKWLSNPNIYLSDFNSLMNRIIDTGIIFELLQEASPLVSRALVDMLLRYIWCHWQFRTSNHHSVVSQFKAWKFNSPSIQPHHVLFRYLCNIELGIYAVGRMDIHALKDSENKILSLLKFLASYSFCNDYIGFIPVLAQAVEFTDRTLSQRLFYELLFSIIKKHKDCCMNDYLIEDTTYLKPLIQHGFWIQNDSTVRKIAENIHFLIVEKYPQTMSWWKEIEGGTVYVNASAKTHDGGTPDGLQSAVGSWLTYTPPIGKQKSNRLQNIKEEDTEDTLNRVNQPIVYEQPNVPGSFQF